MKHLTSIALIFAACGLSGCDRPPPENNTVVVPATVAGPAGPAGQQGASGEPGRQGTPGYTGAQGEPLSELPRVEAGIRCCPFGERHASCGVHLVAAA